MGRVSLLLLLGAGLLAGCGDADGSGGGAAGAPGAGGAASIGAEGAYVGDVAVQTDVPEDAVFAIAEIAVAADGAVSGTVTTKQPTVPAGEVGTVSGSLSGADAAAYQAELVFEWPTAGTFRAAGTLSFGGNALAGQLSARDAEGALVGSTLVSVHQE